MNYYVDTTGNNSNPGTEGQPWRTIQKAHDVVAAGDSIYVRGGVYRPTSPIVLSKDGTSQSKIRLFAYPGEKPIIDGSQLGDGQICLKLDSAGYWHIKGFEVRYAPEYGIYLGSSSYNLLEQLVIHHSGHRGYDGSGLNIKGTSSYNEIVNCDSYLNDNYYAPGEPLIHANADGFAVKDPGAIQNVFSGCRAWRNADDGWDFWTGGPTIIKDCWSWENGFDENLNHLGDGNGFKLGRGNGGHVVTNCLSWKNYYRGFDYNSGGASTLYNNTAWNNGGPNFVFGGFPHVLKNNLSFQRPVSIADVVIDEYNSWNDPPGVSVTTLDFLSLDDIPNRGSRQANGSLPESNFMRLTLQSDCIDVGVSVGLPYSGTAPDLGAYEYQQEAEVITLHDGETHTYPDIASGTYVLTAAVPADWTLSAVETDWPHTDIADGVQFEITAGCLPQFLFRFIKGSAVTVGVATEPTGDPQGFEITLTQI